MAENIKSSTTDRVGEVYLLVERRPDWWLIKGTGQNSSIKASGDRRYVTEIWEEFVTAEKRAIAANYNGMVGYSIRQNLQRP